VRKFEAANTDDETIGAPQDGVGLSGCWPIGGVGFVRYGPMGGTGFMGIGQGEWCVERVWIIGDIGFAGL